MSDLPVDPTITIRAETLLADPNTCKFTVSRTVHPGGAFFFEKKERAGGSPLVERLFAAAIGTAIRTQLLTGVPAILESAHHASTGKRPDAEIRTVVQALLDREVNRSIASHGGQISIVDVQDGNLFVAMNGGCQGCAASQVTLRQGFEVMVRGVAPEIVDIVDTTDHASGKNPFYDRVG
jgi:Fe-S cluster biogenesis protein NfuA